MSIDEEVACLSTVPMFANIDSSRLKLMAFASERLVFKPGQTLFEQGEIGDAAFIVLEGKADVRVGVDGDQLTVATIGQNDIVGEIAILCDIPRTASLVATEELTALKITKDLFFQMVKDFPEMGVEIMRVLAHRLEQTTEQLRLARAQAANA